jgi:hypothetical protein
MPAKILLRLARALDTAIQTSPAVKGFLAFVFAFDRGGSSIALYGLRAAS